MGWLPELARAIDGHRKRGWGPFRSREGIEGIWARSSFVATLKSRLCRQVGDDNPYAEATAVLTRHVLGKSPSQIKRSRGLKDSARTRDHLNRFELNLMRFAEIEAERMIKKAGVRGNRACLAVCDVVGRGISRYLDDLEGALLASGAADLAVPGPGDPIDASEIEVREEDFLGVIILRGPG